MTKRQAHFQAFGYEPLRMKPVHFASGFFIALTGELFENELLNKVAVTKANRGLLGDYTSEAIINRLKDDGLVSHSIQRAEIVLLRTQINGIVNNDAAMYPAFHPYKPKGNDYTFISSRILTGENRTDGFAGFFVYTILNSSVHGKYVLNEGHELASTLSSTLEQLVDPLLAGETPISCDLNEKYQDQFGEMSSQRIADIASEMQEETVALSRLCKNIGTYSFYKRIRYYVLGLLAWLMSYVIKTATSGISENQLVFFDFSDSKITSTRLQSQACYARLREAIGQSYREFAKSGRFEPNPLEAGLFKRRKKNGELDFRFLETHFGDLALRMGYAQPRASRVNQKHFELQPDTLRVLLLSVLNENLDDVMTFDQVCEKLKLTWSVVVGGNGGDLDLLREQGYFGFDEEDLRRNALAFSEQLKSLSLAFEPSDGLVLCSKEIGDMH